VRILFLFLIIGELGLAQFNPPPHLNAVEQSHSLTIGEVFLCPEIRYGLTPYPMLQDEAQLDSINAIAQFIQKYPRFQFEVGVHTDSRGSDQANRELSEKRAKSICEKLHRDFGVSSHQLTYKGYGESQPLVHDSIIQIHKPDKVKYEQLHQMNRRTELRVIGHYQREIDSLLRLRFNKTMQDSHFAAGDRLLCPEIRFRLAHWEVDSAYFSSIALVVEFLKKHPHLVVEVGVHSDTRGSDMRSMVLTQRRAIALGEILQEQFQIPSHQLQLQGYEGSEPIIPNDRILPFYEFEKQEYELRHQVNRRVELKVVSIAQD
jgi:outer membrane protein OmpA-like peptidoglycan-associated protein